MTALLKKKRKKEEGGFLPVLGIQGKKKTFKSDFLEGFIVVC